MDRLKHLLRRLGCPEGPAGRRIFAVGAGGALAVWAAGVGVGLVSWWAREPGGFYSFEVLLGGYGAAFAGGAAAAAFKPARIAVAARLFGRVFDVAVVGSMSANLCALGSISGVVAAAMHKAGHAGATAADGRMDMLVLACLAALVLGCLCSGGIAVKRFRRGRIVPDAESAR